MRVQDPSCPNFTLEQHHHFTLWALLTGHQRVTAHQKVKQWPPSTMFGQNWEMRNQVEEFWVSQAVGTKTRIASNPCIPPPGPLLTAILQIQSSADATVLNTVQLHRTATLYAVHWTLCSYTESCTAILYHEQLHCSLYSYTSPCTATRYSYIVPCTNLLSLVQ